MDWVPRSVVSGSRVGVDAIGAVRSKLLITLTASPRRMSLAIHAVYPPSQLPPAERTGMTFYDTAYGAVKCRTGCCTRSLERYPILLVDGMTTAQFFGREGAAAVQAAVAREAEEDMYGDG